MRQETRIILQINILHSFQYKHTSIHKEGKAIKQKSKKSGTFAMGMMVPHHQATNEETTLKKRLA